MTGQAGMKVAGWREAVRDGMKRYAAGGVGRLAPEENALAVGGMGLCKEVGQEGVGRLARMPGVGCLRGAKLRIYSRFQC